MASDVTAELPQQLVNALEMRGLVAISKRRYEWVLWHEENCDRLMGHQQSPSLRFALWHLARSRLTPSNLRVELNPAIRLRRRRFRRHVDEHGCGRDGRGFAYCPEAMRLWDDLPAKDRFAIG